MGICRMVGGMVTEERVKLFSINHNNLPQIFPERTSVPKTLIFAKDDNHAEEITKITGVNFDIYGFFLHRY